MSDKPKTAIQVFKDNIDITLNKEMKALPEGFNTLRFKQNILTLVNGDSKLKEAIKTNSFDLLRGAMKGAYLGLDFANKECYLIAYKKKTGGYDINFQTDYKGEKKLVKKHSVKPIRQIYAKVVKEGDEFEEGVNEGMPYVTFKPVPFNDGKIIGVFAVVIYEDGSMEYEVMSKSDVEYIRDNFSKKSQFTGQFSDAWVKSFGEMAKKTVLRRLCKHIEIDFDSIEQAKAWEDASDFKFNEEKEEPKEVEKSDLEKELEGTQEENVIETDFEEVEE